MCFLQIENEALRAKIIQLEEEKNIKQRLEKLELEVHQLKGMLEIEKHEVLAYLYYRRIVSKW